MASTLFCKSSFPLAGKLTEWKLLYPDQCNLNTLFPLAGKLTEWKPASGAHRAPSDFPLAGKLTEWKLMADRATSPKKTGFPLAGKLTEWKRGGLIGRLLRNMLPTRWETN